MMVACGKGGLKEMLIMILDGLDHQVKEAKISAGMVTVELIWSLGQFVEKRSL